MTAGRGIIHSEMPQQKDGLMWGFQLWVNLPAAQKMCEPRYQDIPAGAVPELETDESVRIRLIAGESHGRTGAVEGITTEPLYLDVAVPPGQRFEHAIPPGHSACCYVFEGEGELGADDGRPGRRLRCGELAVLGDGEAIAAQAGESPVRFLLLAARPLREPIARYGPFVMSTREQIEQALRELRDGSFLG